MRKNVNRLATLVMTGMLAASMSFSALAVEATTLTENGVATEGARTIKKIITPKDKAKAPSAIFSFTVAPAEEETRKFAGKDSKGNATNYEYKVLAGIGVSSLEEGHENKEEGYFSCGDASFNPNMNVAEDGTYISDFKVDFSKVKFPTAGIYAYTIKENDGYDYMDGNNIKHSDNDYPGMSYGGKNTHKM